ncbi:hypothetical protein D3C86_1924030 [compost metagenome]
MLGIFDWNQIYDPKNEVDIAYAAFDRAETYYDPQDVQDFFDELGVREAVTRINRRYWKAYGKDAMVLIERDDGTASLHCGKEFPDRPSQFSMTIIDPKQLR